MAQELLDAAFRENCDPLRERYSRTITRRTQQGWGRQVEERRSTLARTAEEKQLERSLAETQRVRAEERLVPTTVAGCLALLSDQHSCPPPYPKQVDQTPIPIYPPQHSRHQEDMQRLLQSAGAVKASLDTQVAHVRSRQAAEAAVEAREVASMRAHWERMEAEAAAAEEAERERLRRLAAEVKEFNRLKLAEMSEVERRER